MEQEGLEERGFWDRVADYLDIFGFVVECVRACLIDPFVFLFRRYQASVFSPFRPKQPLTGEEIRKSDKEKDKLYCLNRTKLSFFDGFTPVDGIPAYLMILRHSSNAGTSNTGVQGLETKKRQETPNTPFLLKGPKQTTNCSFSLDSTRFAIGYTSGEVAIWDSNHGTLIKEKTIDGSQVSAVSFLGGFNNILLVCTQDYKCWKWDIAGGDNSEPIEFLDTKELSKIEGEVLSQRSDFFADGTVLVLSTLASCSEGRKLSIVLVDTTLENPMSIEHAYFPLSLKENFVVSQVSMSPDKKGLLVGLTEEGMEESYCMVWPHFATKPDLHRKLDIGTMGSWSHDNKYVVTWTMIGMSSLENINRSSAFIWSIEKIKENPNNLECTFEYQLTSPFKEQVVWCQITQYEEGKDRLIMGIVGETTRFLFWDMKSKVHTHTIETRILTKEMIICNLDAWISYSTKQISVKGLSPIDMTRDGKYFGAILGWPSQVLIWDARLGIQVLKVSPKDLHANHFKGGINLIVSPSCKKFAIIGNETAMVFCPSTANEFRNQETQLLETQMVELENRTAHHDKRSKFKMKFSGNGDILGVLCIGLTKMQLWNLPKGDTYILDAADLGGGNINDFCLSYNGVHLAAYTDDNILVWEYEADTMRPISRIRIDSEVVDMGIKDDGSKIVLCMKDGSILMYHKLSEAKISNVGDDNGTSVCMPSMQGNTEQQHAGPSNSEIEPLLDHDSVDQAPPEDTGNNAPILTESHYKTGNLVGEIEDATFQVSSSFERVIRVSQSQKGEAWDLKEERVINGANIDARSIPRSSHSYSSVSSINESVFEKLQSTEYASLFEGTSITLSKQTTVIQSSKEDIIVAANAASSGLVQKTDSTHYDVEYEAEKHEDSHSVYVINLQDNKCRRRLCGKNLNPKKGLAISKDGRHVACFAGENASKVVVWNVYGSAILLPDYHFLSLNQAFGSKSVIKSEIVPLIDIYGLNFIQFRHPSGMSLLDEAIWYFNNNLLTTILRFVDKKKMKVSFMFLNESKAWKTISTCHNAIEASIARRSLSVLTITLGYLFKRVVHEVEVSTILKQSLINILQVYPQIFSSVLRDRKVLGSCYEIEVPENIFEGQEFITCTSETLLLSKQKAIELWKNRMNFEIASSSTTISAISMTLPYPDACKTACNGLLHHLLVNGAHKNAFASFTIDAIVSYKWRSFARKVMIHEVTHHVVLLIAYMLYCFMICIDGMYKIGANVGNEQNSDATQFSLIACIVLAIPCLYRELRQCVIYTRHTRMNGFLCWLTSAWNWMEVWSYINIVLVLPLLEFIFLKEGKKSILLSIVVGTECVLLWCRVLYYVRVSRKLGKYVTVIAAVVSSVIPFLFIAFCVMFGFAVAFHVLYRHVDTSPLEVDCEECEDDELLSLHKSFGTFGRTLFTVFGYAFGQFDLDNIYYAPNVSYATILFVLYMVIITTTFLNMLIAIMGHEFEGIRRGQNIRFLKAVAMVMDDIEMMMSNRKKKTINDKIGKYLHVAIPIHNQEKVIQGSRLERIQSKHIKEINANIRDNIRREVNRSLSAQYGLARASIESSFLGRNLPVNLQIPMMTILESSEHSQVPVENSEQPNRGTTLMGRNTMVRNRSVLTTIHESNELQRVPAEDQEQWYDSGSSASEFSVTYSDEDAD